MKININMNKIKDLKGKAIALTLATSMLFITSGCKNQGESDKVGFCVTQSKFTNENSINPNEYDLYTYVINTNGFASTKNYDFSESIRPIRFAKVDRSKEYGTNLKNTPTDAYYRSNLKLVWPDCFSLYKPIWVGSSNFDIKLKAEEVKELAGNEYTIVYSSITAKRNLDLGINIFKDGKKPISKGDNISSTAIYYKDELIAYKQTGAGSESQNVIDSTIGNLDIALSTVEDSELLSKNQKNTMSYRELYDYQELINENEYQKKLGINK